MDTSELKPLIKLAIPIMVVNVGNQLMNIVDTMLAGRLGETALAATGIGTGVFFGGAIIGIGVITGLDPIVSQAMGAGRPRLARRSVWQGFYVAAAIALPLGVVVWALGQCLERFGIAPALADEARVYLLHRLPSLLPLLIFVTGRTYLQACQRVRPLIIIMIAANLLNLGGALLLMPSYGIRGLAWAVTGTSFLQMIAMGLVLRGIDPGPGSEPLRAIDAPRIRLIVSKGLPLGFQLLAEVGIFILAGFIMAGITATAAAAHYLVLGIASMTFMVPMSIAAATAVLVGQAIGRGDSAATRRAGVIGIQCAGGSMLLCGAVLILFPAAIARIGTTDAAVIAQSIILLRIAAAFQVFDGVQVAANAALRGAGLTRASLIANLVAYWVVAAPLGWLFLRRMGMGPAGVWWALTTGMAVAAVVCLALFLRVSRRPIAAIEKLAG